MRSLILVRHCEAVPAPPGGDDEQRPLSERGRHQADVLRTWVDDPTVLGSIASARGLVSAAARTRETFARAFGETRLDQGTLTLPSLYNGRRSLSGEEMLDEVRAHDTGDDNFVVVGHSPSVWEFALLICPASWSALREGYPLGGLLLLDVDVLAPGAATFRSLWQP